MLRKFPLLIFIIFLNFITTPVYAVSLLLTPEVVTALDMLGRGMEISEPQKALLFANNDAINNARLNNWISDRQYQAAQSLYADKASELSVVAGKDVGVQVEQQQVKGKGYKAGADTDNIAGITKVEQVDQLENAFDRRAKEYLDKHKVPHDPETVWHEKLNVDFMADPENISQADFERIAAQKDSFYRRKQAAAAERILRMNAEEAPMLNAEHIEAYTQEMQEFIAKKNKFLEAARKNPEYFSNPANKSELLLLMGQEQKYTERLEALNDRARSENHLKPVNREMPGGSHIVIHDEHGNPVMKFKRVKDANGHIIFQERRIGTIAKRGSMRNPENFDTFSASAVSENSVHRALADLAETRAQIAASNPTMADNAASAVAQITKELPPSERAFTLERIRKARGNEFAAEVARHMREASPPKPNTAMDAEFARTVDRVREILHEEPGPRTNPVYEKTRAWDESFQRAVGITTDKTGMSLTRQQVNELVEKGLPKFNALMDAVAVVQTSIEAGSQMGEYAYHITAAMDKDVPDAVAQQHFEAAQHVAYGMIATGTLGTGMTMVMEAFPTVGAVVGTYGVTYEGSRFVLENTRTGQYIDKVAGGAFDIGFRGVDKLSDLAAVMTGGETQAQREQREGAQLCDSFSRALQAGRIKLREGASVDELQDACMNRDIDYIHSDLIEDTTPDKPEPKPPETERREGGPFAVGIYFQKAGDNLGVLHRIGIVLPKDMYKQFQPSVTYEAWYGNLKMLREGLSLEQARQFIFLAMFGEGAPVAGGDFGVGIHRIKDRFLLNVIRQHKTAANREAYMRKHYRDLKFINEDMAEHEAKDWLCLQVTVSKGQDRSSCRDDLYLFQNKIYPVNCSISTCQAWNGYDDKLGFGDSLVWGLPITPEREEWILSRITELVKAPLAAEETAQGTPSETPMSWEEVAAALQGDLPDKPSPVNKPQNQGDASSPGQSENGAKNPQSWGDVSQQMQNESGTKTPQSWGDVAQQMQGTKDHENDLPYILQNRHNPELVSPAQLEAALNHPHFWQQPEAQQFIEGWLDKALPEHASKDPTARYEKWGRVTGRGISIAGDPDIHEPRYQYLWRNADKFPSLNLCSMKEFVKRSLMEQSMADCPVAQAAVSSQVVKPEGSGNGSATTASATPTKPVQKNMPVQCTVATDAPARKLEAVQHWTHQAPVPGSQPIIAVFLTYWDKQNFDFNGIKQKWSAYLDKVEIVTLSGDAPKGEDYGSMEDMQRLTTVPFGLDVNSKVHYALSGNMVRDFKTYPHVLVFDRSGYIDEDIPGYSPARDDSRLRKAVDRVIAQPCGQRTKTHDRIIIKDRKK